MTNQNQEKETEGFAINWKGVAKWTVIGGVIVGAYYVGKKQGAKAEAMKHQVVSEPIAVNTVETPEI